MLKSAWKLKKLSWEGAHVPGAPLDPPMDMPAQRHWKVDILLISNITLRDKQ